MFPAQSSGRVAVEVKAVCCAVLRFRRKSEVMLGHGLFSLLTERLMLHSNQFTVTTYNVLFEVRFPRPSLPPTALFCSHTTITNMRIDTPLAK